MRDTLITLAGALVSLFLLVSLMSPPPDQSRVSRPTTEDNGKHGLRAVHRWLDESSVNTYSLRKPITRIDQTGLPASGNLMIVSLPLAREALDSEWVALNDWIRDGNTLLVLAGLYHSPRWRQSQRLASGSDIIAAMDAITAEEFTLEREDIEQPEKVLDLTGLQASIKAFKPSPYRLYPAVEHALFDDVYELESRHTPGLYQTHDESDGVQSVYWSLGSESSRLALRLLFGESQALTAMWLLPAGDGWIYLSAFPDLISNSVLNEQDNARWFANLLAHTLAEDGYVVFDDYHFGLSDLYDPDAFFADPRLHDSLLFIGAFWLIYALGRSPRLAPVRNRSRKPATRDLVEAMAGFFSRRIRSRAIAEQLARRLLGELRRHTRLEGESLWRWLHDHPDVSARDIARLQRAAGYVQGHTRLIPLTRSIERIHRVLA